MRRSHVAYYDVSERIGIIKAGEAGFGNCEIGDISREAYC
jgi:hypothetical protein